MFAGVSQLICNSVLAIDLSVQHLCVLVIKSGVAGGV